LAAICPDIELPEIEKAIAETMPERLAVSNIKAVRTAKEAIKEAIT